MSVEKQANNCNIPDCTYIASELTPMDEVIEHAGKDMSCMQINTNQNDTHISECVPTLMKIDQ